jgi:hypothetical protein
MLTNFLISCSGANREILKECSFERAKYIGIGLTNVLIAILSSVSVGFFVSFAFTDKQTSRLEIDWFYLLPVCIIWGLLIFNLDRSIIISIRKTGTKKQQFLQAFPRILIAVFIGIVISTPFELKIFADEIKVQLEKNLKDDIGTMKEENKQIHSSGFKLADSVAAMERAKLIENEKRRNQLNTEMILELEGRGFSKQGGKGPIYKQKEREFYEADSLYNIQAKIYEAANKTRDSVLGMIRETDTKDEKIVNNVNGPAAQIVALHQLPGVHWFVTILFILLETMPVIVKLMSKTGLYDEILERIEMETRLKEEVIKADKTSKKNYAITEIDEINRLESELRLARERHRIAVEMKAIGETPGVLEPTNPKPPPESEITQPGNEEPVLTEIKEPAKPVESTAGTESPPVESTAITPTPLTEPVKETSDLLSFENKIWKDHQAVDDVKYCFIRDEQLKKLMQVINNLEKTGSWEYHADQKLLVMNIEGSHREYKIISETPTVLHLQSLMGKALHLTTQ